VYIVTVHGNVTFCTVLRDVVTFECDIVMVYGNVTVCTVLRYMGALLFLLCYGGT
jgi:hypothetical protein